MPNSFLYSKTETVEKEKGFFYFFPREKGTSELIQQQNWVEAILYSVFIPLCVNGHVCHYRRYI